MMLLFQGGCLCITLCVLQKYIITGTHSGTHRLLPLVLGLIATYNFYEIVATFMEAAEVFACLKDLLLIQMLHLLLFYALDFLHIKLPGFVEYLLFAILLGMDGIVLFQHGTGSGDGKGILFFILWYLILIAGLATYAYIRYSFSKREHHVANIIYLAFVVPAVSLFLVKLHVVTSEIWMPASLACTCIFIYYLLDTDQLMNTLSILQEQQYDTADIAIVSFDADYYYLGANMAARQLFADVLDVPRRKSKSGERVDDIKEMTRNMDRPRMFEYRGRYYKCQINAVYYNERLKGYNLSVIDITEQKNETRMMASLREAAEDKTVSKSRFLATMSHDLRSPLQAIIGIGDILAAKREISSKNRALILHIKSAGETLLTQVDAILDYSKLESGKFILARQVYNLDSILEELAHMSVINLQSKPIQFSLHVKGEHPRQLVGDEMRVREIIQNLLANAAKYTKEGRIDCEITCRMQPEARRAYITCSVKDTGAGMSEKQLEQAFDEYVSFADGRMARSAGLGLCIVKQLAERMGGSVSAVSDGVSGSTVTASFYQEYTGEEVCPEFTLDKDTILRQTTAFHHNVRPAFTYPKAKVLLADDMRINQEIFRELVQPWKFEVVVAEDGKKAVEMAKTEEYQLIFLDQMMPEMMGDEAAFEIRKFSNTPLIMMTANLSDELRNEYLQKGFMDFLPKPIEILALQKIIEQHMPHAYRYDPSFEEGAGGFLDSRSRGKANRRTLETFIYEVEPLAEKLSHYAKDDLELFRIKVHGIKGASRQIGKVSLSERAEIMEMAAKTQNISFIEEHMADLQKELEEAISQAREDIANIPTVYESSQAGETDKEELFARLKTGFDNYELGEIEECIAALEHASLTTEELELLEQAKNACNEMDYEAGSALFL
ncbi:MAG: response regulator [Clostridiales bacterium]|nr:response regulator [Roseburia sp.]MDD7637275.1 response regulator [Clostridiales bacterium]MDY4112948.1 response regulator [Roseburia sp.]